jgi:hypothetical protein
MIFKVGKYPQGDFGKDRMQKLVDAYDPEKNIEAPVVIGHRSYSDTMVLKTQTRCTCLSLSWPETVLWRMP